jgi:hypothetical protein
MDREKVISDIEQQIRWIEEIECHKFPGWLNVTNAMRDAIDLLKEQEAVTIKKTKEHGFGVYGGICPKCRNWIQSAHSFCGFCGQAVKWE